jgi:hypothetical protein
VLALYRRALPALLITLTLGTACVDPLTPDVTINRVTLTPVTASIGIGATQQMTAVARNRRSDPIPDIPFVFESLQPAIATVSESGLVTAISPGTATIRATTGTFVATATITVTIPECTNATATATISASLTINGTLTSSDCLFTGVGNADGYRFVAAAPTTVLFTLTGATLRPKISLTGTTAGSVIKDSWSTVLGDTARLVVSVAAGTYTLWVVENSDDFGPYVLKSESAVACSPSLATTPIALDQSVNGALTSTSCYLPNDAEGMGWSFSLATESDVRFDIGADGFEPWIVITNPSLQIVSNSIPVGTDSAVLMDRLPAGNYTVWVTTIEGGQGTFALSRSAAVFNFCDATSDTITVPGIVNGTLSADDCVLEPGYLSDPIFMQVLTPTTLRVDLVSADFDAVLAVADSNDIVIATNDDGMGVGSTNSRIQATFPAGRYTLLPQAYEPNSSGAYTLSVTITAGINQGNIRLSPKPRTRLREWSEFQRE